ncbi:MAG: GNAT family N-acetyltransferase [Deltaproteobacteria bacterium]|nr:GNAT family N-acetyltransferase [Deltaproteobacteria bacterium]
MYVDSKESFPDWMSVDKLADFLGRIMRPYEDTVEDIARGLEYALSKEQGRGGFIILAAASEIPLGAVVFLKTGMKGYVPGNLLLFVGVHPDYRGKGIGRELISRAADRCEGDIKLHVEPDNPARRLYELLGFKNKYIEYRYHKE